MFWRTRWESSDSAEAHYPLRDDHSNNKHRYTDKNGNSDSSVPIITSQGQRQSQGQGQGQRQDHRRGQVVATLTVDIHPVMFRHGMSWKIEEKEEEDSQPQQQQQQQPFTGTSNDDRHLKKTKIGR